MRHRVVREAPLFPCYAFVRLNHGQMWSKINNTYGVVRLLTDRNRENPTPLWIDDHYIASISRIRARIEDARLPVNTLVRIKQIDSPLYDLVGTIIEMDKHERIKVLMSLFNRDVVVQFDTPAGVEVLALPGC